MKNFYIAIQIKENDKFYAYTIKVNTMDNILSKLEINNIVAANICATKKNAEEIVYLWNESFRNNGTYLFQ